MDMEVVMLPRLQLIISKLDELTTKALGFIDQLTNLEEADIIVKKLQISLSQFDTELRNYLHMSTDPSVDVSSFNESRLKAEKVLAELSIKLQGSETDSAQTLNNDTLSHKLNHPEFDGDILGWYQFWDQFNSNIASRNLSDVEKLIYLKSSLKGDAKRTIEGLETTNNNYQIAISILHDRYGKRNHVIDAHYAALYKTRKGNNITEARSILNEVEKHLRVLKSLGEDINHIQLRFLIMEKFPEDIIYEMKSVETIEEMRKNLEIIISAKEDSSRITPEDTTEEYTTQNYMENTMKQFKRKIEKKELKKKPESKIPKLICIFCKGTHHNDECKNVKTLKDRKERLVKTGHCYNCLYKGHNKNKCKKIIFCVHCKSINNHNRALCPKRFSYKGVSTSKTHFT